MNIEKTTEQSAKEIFMKKWEKTIADILKDCLPSSGKMERQRAAQCLAHFFVEAITL